MYRLSFAALVAAAVAANQISLAVAAGPVDPGRAAELDNLVRQDCGSCHGLTMKGGLGPPLLPGVLADRDEQSLADAILDGVPETPMPPWRVEITPDEARWIVRRLKRGLDR